MTDPGGDLRPIPSHPEYLASDSGRVWSLKSDRYLRDYPARRGYRRVNLSERGVRVGAVGVHRLVCEAFHGPAPEGKPWALHRNGDPSDNTPGNLYWGSPKDNVKDMISHGTHPMLSRLACGNGHRYTPGSTRVSPKGRRECRLCHREWARKTALTGLKQGDPRHGTNTGYANWGCRCSRCLMARREYIRDRRKS